VTSLGGEVLGGIERKANHEKLGLAAEGQGCNASGILLRAATLQGWKGGHRETERVTTRQPYALSPHIKGEGRRRGPGGHLALPDGCGQGARGRFPLVQHGFEPEGSLTGWLDDFLSTPNGACHQELLPQKRGP
jgi:hypothetical protein